MDERLKFIARLLEGEALKELGVQAMGHRMTLLRAIESFDSVREPIPHRPSIQSS